MSGPINLTIDSSSITRLAVHFDEITPALQAKLKVAISRITHQLLAQVRAAEPVRTGRLRSLTRAYVDERENFVRGRVRILGQKLPNQPARAFGALEYGGPGRRGGKVQVRWSSRGGVGVTAYERRRPRRQARRFLRGPAAAMRPQIRAQLAFAIGQAINEFDFSTVNKR
jgi:hypothetical protein